MDRRAEIGGVIQSPAAAALKSPYPGLRSFAREEADVFFGRDRCISGMTETLQNTRFLAVLGPSGSGKSSLVRSGLFMHLEAGLARKAGARWTFLDMKHPRTTPFAELARMTLESERPADPAGKPAEPSRADVEERRKALSRDPFALVRWWSDRPGRHPEENLLLLVDQFEELFGYSTDRERNEVEAFIDLLLESTKQDKLAVYVVITMRSEFLGGCSLFPGLAEQINSSLSLTPRMTREECREAITGPAFAGDLILEDVLVTAILNDMNSLARFDDPAEGEAEAEAEAPSVSQADLIARRADQLPLMQHVLNWMWNIQAHGPDAVPDSPIHLTLEQYLALGRLRGAMNVHANDVMAGTGDPDSVARIFRALTDQPTVATTGSAESSAVRRRRTVAELADEAAVDPDRVRAIIDAYRADGVSMLNPDPESRPKLDLDDEVDISHESLIRQWGALRGWIRDEGEAGRNWQELLRDVEKGTLLTGLDLAERRGWWQRTQPHGGWANRYGGAYAEVSLVMDRSNRRERRRKMLLRGATASAVVLAIASVGSVAFTQQARSEAARALAKAEAESENARRSAAVARQSTLETQISAQRARTEARAAIAQRAEAQKAVAAARLAAAAASRQAQLAAVQVIQARNEQAAIAQRSHALATRIADRTRGQIPLLLTKPPADAQAMVADIDNDMAMLRDSEPTVFAAIEPELERMRGKVASYRLDTRDMAAVALATQTSVPRAGSEPGQSRAVRLSQAALLQGRAEVMEGRRVEALESFKKAASLVPANGPEGLNLAHAEALYEQASLQLEDGSQAEAAEAATQCMSSLPEEDDAMSALGRMAEAQVTDEAKRAMLRASARSMLGRTRCQTILGATAESEEDSAKYWQEASKSLGVALYVQMMATGSEEPSSSADVDLSEISSDFVVRYFRRQKTVGRQLPEEIVLPAGIAFMGVVGDDDGDQSASFVDPGRFYPLDALHRMEAINVIMRWYAHSGQDSGISTTDALVMMKVNQGLSRALPGGGQVPSGLVRRVSDAFHDQATNWIGVYERLDSRSSDQIDAAFAQAAKTIARHWKFVRDIPETAISDAERLDLTSRIRVQAAQLVQTGRANIQTEAYGTLVKEGRNLLGQVCDESDPSPPECKALAGSIDEVQAATRAYLSSLSPSPLAGIFSDTVWTDADGLALGGRDPVACFDHGSGFRPAVQTRGVANRDLAGAARTCTLGLGKLRYALRWGHQVWLFDREENRTRFQSEPGLYMPRLGGYDYRQIQQSRKTRFSSSEVSGVVVGRRLYLAENLGSSEEPKPEEIARAEQNWLTLKASPEVDSSPEAIADAVEAAADLATDVSPPATAPPQPDAPVPPSQAPTPRDTPPKPRK